MRRRDNDEIGEGLAAGARANEPGVGGPTNGDDSLPQVPYTPFRQERVERLVDVATEVLPARKSVRGAQRSGVPRDDA
jgi:hypothetical protein